MVTPNQTDIPNKLFKKYNVQFIIYTLWKIHEIMPPPTLTKLALTKVGLQQI